MSRHKFCRSYGDQQGTAALEARRGEVGEEGLVHFDGLHEFDVVEMALRANRLGGEPELIAKRPRECLVGAVAGIECDGEDIGRTVGRESAPLRSGGGRAHTP